MRVAFFILRGSTVLCAPSPADRRSGKIARTWCFESLAVPSAGTTVGESPMSDPGALTDHDRIAYVGRLVGWLTMEHHRLGCWLRAALTDAPTDDDTPIEFVVEPGDTPATLAPRLAEAGVIGSERAFLFEARMGDLASRLQAGRYALAANLTPAEVVTGLVENRIVTRTMDVNFREGLRL